MEKEIKFKKKLSKIFASSCKTQNLSEVIDHQNPIFTSQIPLMDENDPLSSSYVIRPKHQMMCKPRCPESFDQMIRENCIIPTAGNPFPRRKIAGRYSLLSLSGDFSGRWCPPASPVSPLNQRELKQGKKKKKKKKKKNKKDSKYDKTHLRNYPFSLSSSNETDLGDWFSSDDEREDDEQETETLFSSSKSLSLSDSDPDNPTWTQPRTRNRKPRRKAGLGQAGPFEVGVKDTFAVVKSSSDPYNDFRTSMVEMIMEKQIFGAKELEELLQCFLSLNSAHHHRVIVEVFTEILDALFSNCP